MGGDRRKHQISFLCGRRRRWASHAGSSRANNRPAASLEHARQKMARYVSYHSTPVPLLPVLPYRYYQAPCTAALRVLVCCCTTAAAAAAAKNLTAATVGGSFPVGAVVRISRKSLAKVGEASIIPSPQQQLGDPTGGETKQKTRKSSGETQENDSSRVSDSKHRRRNSAPQSSFRDQRRRNAHPFTVIVDSDNNTTTTTSTSSWSKSSSSNLLDWTLEQVSCGAGLCVVADPALLDDRPDCIPSRYLRNNSSNSSSSSTRHSLYRRTMTTAALVNEEANATAATASPQQQQQQQQQQDFNHNLAFKQTAAFARGFADDAGRAIGNLLPKASLQQLTTRKYTLPDKTVASQVLMYRQLLHTKCRPGLKLSRDFQGTPAQKAVMHMPWWEEGIEQTKKMTISYDNLITRLWLNGAIDPFIKDGSATATSTPKPVDDTVDFLDLESNSNSKEDNDDAVPATKTADDSTTANSVETYITDAGLPPVPHLFWVERLGFQQNDPVTDFRSGGVLSLAMMVYMVESHPAVCQRFFTGDASVLPFGITCINVTDMIAKFLMLAKATDRMDALLSQKPFWRMFADPNAILAVQELAMTMLADVVVELTKERQVPALAKKHSSSSMHGGESSNKVSGNGVVQSPAVVDDSSFSNHQESVWSIPKYR